MKSASDVLKIAFVLDDGLDSEDGVQQYIKTVGTWLINQGHTVHYLVGQTKRTDIENVYSLAKNKRVSFNGNKLSIPLPASKKAIQQVLEQNDYDILHVQIPHSPFFASKVVNLAEKNAAIIGTFHILPYGLAANIGTKMLGIWQRNNLKKFNSVVSVSSAAQQFAKESFKVDSIVIPNAVDIETYKTRKTAEHFKPPIKILFLGRLVARKGCGYLIEALYEVSKRRSDIKFHLDICGKGELDTELKNLVKRLGLDQRVAFRGFVSDEKKKQYMREADLAIFPSYAGESFGIVLIEAMAADSGVVIGGNNPGYLTVLGELPETIIDVHDKQSFANRLETLMTDKKLQKKLHEKQSELVKKYDINVVGPKLLEEYYDCIKKQTNR